MTFFSTTRRSAIAAVLTAAGVLSLPALAAAHATVSPAVSVSGKLQLYSLAVPTEKSGLTTTRIVLTVPSGFGIDSFVAPPQGWTQRVQRMGGGDSAVVTRVTWTGGRTPAGRDSLFQFLAQPTSAETYAFQVQQTYSDGSVVNWTGPASSAAPAPTIQVAASLGGGGVSVLTVVALIVGVLGLLTAGFALVGGSEGRALA
jgi:uncharacterized protein YcnI